MKNKNEIALTEKFDLEESTSLLHQLLKDCPDPTQLELRRLLAVQGAILNNHGLSMLLAAEKSSEKRNITEKQIRLALQLLRDSRECLIASSKVEIGVDMGEDEE